MTSSWWANKLTRETTEQHQEVPRQPVTPYRVSTPPTTPYPQQAYRPPRPATLTKENVVEAMASYTGGAGVAASTMCPDCGSANCFPMPNGLNCFDCGYITGRQKQTGGQS